MKECANDRLFSEDTEHHKHQDEPRITHEEKIKKDMTSIIRKKQKMIEISPDPAQFEGEPRRWQSGYIIYIGSSKWCSPILKLASTNLDRPLPLRRVWILTRKTKERQFHKRRISSTRTLTPAPEPEPEPIFQPLRPAKAKVVSGMLKTLLFVSDGQACFGWYCALFDVWFSFVTSGRLQGFFRWVLQRLIDAGIQVYSWSGAQEVFGPSWL